MRNVALALACALLLGLFGYGRTEEPKLPDGPGKQLTERICTACQGIETAVSQRHDRAAWQKIIDDMVTRGADGTNEELKAICEYLTKYFGPKENAK
jgi:hypothetical protein